MKKHSKSALKRIFWFFSIPTLLFVFFIVGFVLSIKFGFWGEMPSDEELKEIIGQSFEVPPTIEVYTADSILLDEYANGRSYPIPYSDLPQHLIDALVTVEDTHFFQHSGIYIKIRHFQAYTTISQKALYGLHLYHSSNLILRHLKSWLMAHQLEQLYSKETILAFYLNQTAFGNGTVGIQAAAKLFFACNTKDLNIQQAVVLIGMIQGSVKFNPLRKPELSLRRRNVTLQLMARQGKLLQEVADSLKQLPLGL